MNKEICNGVLGLFSYKNVSRTFTYGILLAAIPLLVIYENNLPNMSVVENGKHLLMGNGAEGILKDFGTFFGFLSQNYAHQILLLEMVTGSLLGIWYEKRKWGAIEIRAEFLFFTLAEATLFSLLITPVLSMVFLFNFPIPFARGYPDLSALPIYFGKNCGDGFYEELLFRVILLGSIVKIVRKFCSYSLSIETFTVVGVSLLFSLIHYTGWFGLEMNEDFTMQNFMYHFFLGITYGTIYLKRGFATAAWTHTLGNFWVYANLF
jgi:hypothetical protein